MVVVLADARRDPGGQHGASHGGQGEVPVQVSAETEMRYSLYLYCSSFLDIPDGLTTFQHPDSFSRKSQDKYWRKLEKEGTTSYHLCGKPRHAVNRFLAAKTQLYKS